MKTFVNFCQYFFDNIDSVLKRVYMTFGISQGGVLLTAKKTQWEVPPMTMPKVMGS